jgi:putative acetyltransferase
LVPAVPEGEISIDDPRATDVSELLDGHLVFNHSHSPPEDVHALDVDGLLDPTVTSFSFRLDGELLGAGALKQLDGGHAELKSMHVAHAARGGGIGRLRRSSHRRRPPSVPSPTHRCARLPTSAA